MRLCDYQVKQYSIDFEAKVRPHTYSEKYITYDDVFFFT